MTLVVNEVKCCTTSRFVTSSDPGHICPWNLRFMMDNRQIRENLGHISQCERGSVRSNARQKCIESSKLKLKKVLDVQKWFSREGGLKLNWNKCFTRSRSLWFLAKLGNKVGRYHIVPSPSSALDQSLRGCNLGIILCDAKRIKKTSNDCNLEGNFSFHLTIWKDMFLLQNFGHWSYFS